MQYSTILVILAALLLFGCSTPEAYDTGVTEDGVRQVVEANNQFALELYSKYQTEEGNIFFSPYSISTALAMTYEGAQGQTAEEMHSVFHFPAEATLRRPAFARIYNEINSGSKDYQLKTANALWAQQDYAFLPEYLETAENYYGGKVTNLDFAEPVNSANIINSWVEEQTNDKIKDLIPSGFINEYTRLVLTNAIYFKGDWAIQFEKSRTREGDFKVSPSYTVKAQMMSVRGEEAKFNYAETEELQILELPYKGEEVSMLILLPKGNHLGDTESALSIEKLAEYRGNLMEREVEVTMPKFKFETKYEMADDLAEMGMPTAFSTEADFSGMTGNRDLYISDIVHQAYIDVNEEGTEAAAATAVGMKLASMPVIVRFVADHPFIFIIQEKQTGVILFMGRLTDPTK